MRSASPEGKSRNFAPGRTASEKTNQTRRKGRADCTSSWLEADGVIKNGTRRLDQAAREVLSLFHQAAQQPNLPGVINIVKGNAPKGAGKFCRLRFAQRAAERFAQRQVLAAQYLFVPLPGRFPRLACFRPGEEIAAGQDEAAAFAACKLAANHIFPIGGVQRLFPDIVPAGSGPPRGLLRRHAPERLP